MANETLLIDAKPLIKKGWHLVQTGESNGSCGCAAQIITGIIYDEDFCSYGERKDNDNN